MIAIFIIAFIFLYLLDRHSYINSVYDNLNTYDSIYLSINGVVYSGTVVAKKDKKVCVTFMNKDIRTIDWYDIEQIDKPFRLKFNPIAK